MTWITIQTQEWLKAKEPFTLVQSFLYVVAVSVSQKTKGKINSTVRDLAYIWTVTEPRVTKYLDELRKMGLISYVKEDKNLSIEIVNFQDYPTPSHQKPVTKKQVRSIRDIKDRLPSEGLNREENMAVWIWRQIRKVVGENHRTLNMAYLEDWCRHIKLMKEVDGRKDEEMVEVVKWALKDEFWSTVLRSTSGLREHYDKIRDASLRSKVKEEPKTEQIEKGKWLNKKEGEI